MEKAAHGEGEILAVRELEQLREELGAPGCEPRGIPTVSILHVFASVYVNVKTQMQM